MIEFHNKTIFEALGRNPIHPFSARMAPGIALEVLRDPQKPFRILDPMMGSGTVIAVARSNGHRAIGIDTDPLAVLISKVWSTSINPEEMQERAVDVLNRARLIFPSLSTRNSYPPHADKETKRFISYWFDEYARRQLASLSIAIHRVRNEATRDVLWCGFSRLIIAKQAGASLAMDLAHSRPHKSFRRAPSKPFNSFLAAVKRVAENCVDKRKAGRGPAPRFYEGDARDLPLSNSSFDAVITSPPYLNAIDYIRCSKFTLVWMGHSVAQLRRIRATSVGTGSHQNGEADQEIAEIISELKLRPKLMPARQEVLARYIHDMRLSLQDKRRRHQNILCSTICAVI